MESSSAETIERREEEEVPRSRVAVGISLFELAVDLEFEEKVTNNLPLPLDPSAIVRFNPSFLICIATCYPASVS